MTSYVTSRPRQTMIATIHSTHHCAELGYHISTEWYRTSPPEVH
jgi:hypothetical protein